MEVVSIDALIHKTALKYKLNENHLSSVIKCESRFNVAAEGDSHTSIGIAQIHLTAHPEITKEEALDPAWSIDWMGQQWANGDASAWSCFSIEEKNGWK